MMSLPNGAVAFRRPPRETRPALADLIKSQPRNAELYSLRALEDEQQLDFTAAESDWKAYARKFFRQDQRPTRARRFLPSPSPPSGRNQDAGARGECPARSQQKSSLRPTQQRSWQAFERIFGVIQAQGLPKEVSIAQYRAWIARYPDEPSLYARFLEFLVAEKEYSAAGATHCRLSQTFSRATRSFR